MKEFITENNISFEPGSRNSSMVILIGYAQFKGLSKGDLKTELFEEIQKDRFIKDEIDRLWDYCNNRNYKNFWSEEKAKEQYKF